MEPSSITVDWLKFQNFSFDGGNAQERIEGLILRPLRCVADERGDLTELWSLGWPDSADFLSPVHCYQSTTRFGVTKGWHLHESHTNQIAITKGKLQIILVDVRPGSVTFGSVNNVYAGTDSPFLLKIPSGIMYAWKALSWPEVSVTSFRPNLYDPKEDFHFPLDSILSDAWDTDPILPEKP